jgi:SAM-dependent methyltransferase
MESCGETAVLEWRTLWSDIYGRQASAGEAPPDLAGWTSSYTGRPIAEREMREWIDRTVERILALGPRRLLEVGCGMGLLLTRLAPACEECWGVDFSPEAVAAVSRAFAGRDLPVVVRQQAADDLTGLPPGRFDTVILSSVIQYFPNLAYLRRVLAGICALAAPGARIFLGDLRSLPLLSTFHLSVLLQQADGATPLAEIRERLLHRLGRERELVLDPALFATLGSDMDIANIAAVDVQLKRGRERNELTRFRYDVTLTLAGGGTSGNPAMAGEAAGPEPTLDWREAGLSLAALRRLLGGGAPAAPRRLRIAGVPNARLAAEVAAESLLHREPGLTTVAELQEALRGCRAAASTAAAVEPEDLWALSRDLPYRVGIHWGASPGTFDVALHHL